MDVDYKDVSKILDRFDEIIKKIENNDFSGYACDKTLAGTAIKKRFAGQPLVDRCIQDRKLPVGMNQKVNL